LPGLLRTPKASDALHPGIQAHTPGQTLHLSAQLIALLPTPAAGNFNDGESAESWQARKEREMAKGRNGNGIGTPLAMAVKMLPTPEAKLGRSGPDYARAEPSGRPRTEADEPLTERVQRLLPTPTSRDHKGAGYADQPGRPLSETVHRLLPTPNATDGQGGVRAVPERRTHGGKDHGPRLRDVAPLLPTPCATDAKGARNATAGRKPGSQHHSGETLLDVFWNPPEE